MCGGQQRPTVQLESLGESHRYEYVGVEVSFPVLSERQVVDFADFCHIFRDSRELTEYLSSPRSSIGMEMWVRSLSLLFLLRLTHFAI